MNRPDNNPKSVFGMAKPGIHAIPMSALLHCGRAMEDGEGKYGLTNWRENSVSAMIYFDAAFRHMAAWWDGEEVAQDSGVHHLGHVMACCAILLDAQRGGNLIDDRPSVPGGFADLVAEMTRKVHKREVAKPESEGGTGFFAGCKPNISLLEEMIAASGEAASVGRDGADGLCVDEGCPQHGTPHVCIDPVRLAEEIAEDDERRWESLRAAVAATAAHESATWADKPRVADMGLLLESEKSEAARRLTEAGETDPTKDKTHEIRAVVRRFLAEATGAGDRPEQRSDYVFEWLDQNGFDKVSEIGSIRDQCALYDAIDRYETLNA